MKASNIMQLDVQPQTSNTKTQLNTASKTQSTIKQNGNVRAEYGDTESSREFKDVLNEESANEASDWDEMDEVDDAQNKPSNPQIVLPYFYLNAGEATQFARAAAVDTEALAGLDVAAALKNFLQGKMQGVQQASPSNADSLSQVLESVGELDIAAALKNLLQEKSQGVQQAVQSATGTNADLSLKVLLQKELQNLQEAVFANVSAGDVQQTDRIAALKTLLQRQSQNSQPKMTDASLLTADAETAAASKSKAMQNLDFLASVRVHDGAKEQQADCGVAEFAKAGVKTAAGEENAAVLQQVAGKKLATDSVKPAQDTGVLTDEQTTALALKNAGRSVKVAVAQAATRPESATDLIASLNERLQALNDALGAKTKTADKNQNVSAGRQQTFFVHPQGVDSLNEAFSPEKTAASQPRTAADYDIPKQIIEQARLVRVSDGAEMIIKLKPEHLGELTLKVTVGSNGTVSANFHTNNPDVRAAIESSILQLKQELQQQGLKVDSIDVYSDKSQLFGGEGGQHAAAQQQQQQRHGRTFDWNALEDDFKDDDTIAVTKDTVSDSAQNEDSVDYRV